MSLRFDLSLSRGASTWRIQAELPMGPSVIVGHSGSGKSTLLDMIAGLVQPETGRVELDGRVLTDTAAGMRVPPHQRGLGYAFQDDRLFPHLSVVRNLTFSQAHRGPPELSLERVVAGLGLGPLLDRHPEALSGGEKKRVGLGRALLATRQGLLLDEPFSGLNPELAVQVADFILEVTRHLPHPTVLVTHAKEALLPADLPVWTMRDGQLRPEARV